jgi:hypothetical protein
MSKTKQKTWTGRMGEALKNPSLQKVVRATEKKPKKK